MDPDCRSRPRDHGKFSAILQELAGAVVFWHLQMCPAMARFPVFPPIFAMIVRNIARVWEKERVRAV